MSGWFYIIDTYSPYFTWGHESHITKINDSVFCVRKVYVEDGTPRMPELIEDSNIGTLSGYATREEAAEFLHKIQRLNGGLRLNG